MWVSHQNPLLVTGTFQSGHSVTSATSCSSPGYAGKNPTASCQKDCRKMLRTHSSSSRLCLFLLNVLSALQLQGHEAAGQAAALAQNAPSSCLQSSSHSSPPRLLLQPHGSSPLISPSSCSGQPPCLSESPSHLTFVLTFSMRDPKAQQRHNAHCSAPVASSRYEPNRWAPPPTRRLRKRQRVSHPNWLGTPEESRTNSIKIQR